MRHKPTFAGPVSSPAGAPAISICLAVQDFGARTIKPHGVVPTLHNRKAIRNLAVATAELDANRAVVVFLRQRLLSV
jgi:hypothetical protein